MVRPARLLVALLLMHFLECRAQLDKANRHLRLVPQPFYSSSTEWSASRKLISPAEPSEEGSALLSSHHQPDQIVSWRCVEVREAGLETRRAVASLVSRFESIDYLRFCSAGLGDEGALEALAASRHVLGLAIESDLVSRHCLDAAAKGFPRLTVGDDETQSVRLRELSLRRTGLEASAARSLARLVGFYPELEALYVGANPEVGDDGARALSDVAARSAHLHTIELSECGLDDEACFTLARALKRLKHLDISLNPDVTGLGLAAIVSKCNSLETLDAAGCRLTGESADALATALRRSTSLRSLSLANTHLTPRAATRIILTLSRAPRLHTLDLSGNPLTPKAFQDQSNFFDKLFKSRSRLQEQHHFCALCAAAASLRRSSAFPKLELLALNDVGARLPHDALFQSALAKTPRPNLYLDLRYNRLITLQGDDDTEAAGAKRHRRRSEKDPPLVD